MGISARSRFARLRSAVTVAAALVFAACFKVPAKSGAMAFAPNVDIGADQLQLQVYEMGRRFSGDIVRASDSIALLTTDPRVRQRALMWKLDGIPLVQEAALRDDPLIAEIDLAAFADQQEAYFTSGEGREVFGAQQPLAVNASHDMVAQMNAAVLRTTKNGQISEEALYWMNSWVARHPLVGPQMQRQSILGADWDPLTAANGNITQTVSSMNRTLRGVTLRLGYLNETLADQMRWNAQALMSQALGPHGGDSLLASGAITMRAMGDLAADAPTLVARERTALLAGVDRQRALTLADVDRQRLETLRAVDGERVAMSATLAAGAGSGAQGDRGRANGHDAQRRQPHPARHSSDERNRWSPDCCGKGRPRRFSLSRLSRSQRFSSVGDRTRVDIQWRGGDHGPKARRQGSRLPLPRSAGVLSRVWRRSPGSPVSGVRAEPRGAQGFKKDRMSSLQDGIFAGGADVARGRFADPGGTFTRGRSRRICRAAARYCRVCGNVRHCGRGVALRLQLSGARVQAGHPGDVAASPRVLVRRTTALYVIDICPIPVLCY